MMSINKQLWNEIEEDLGDITDFEIHTGLTEFEYIKTEIRFKSNGVAKVIASSGDMYKHLIQCAYYIGALQSPIKKYKHGS